MYLFKGIKTSETVLQVTAVYNLEIKENENIDQTDGVVVQDYLQPDETKLDKLGCTHFVNPQTGEQWYEYTARPLTIEEELGLVKEENALLQASQIEMTMYAASQDERLEQQEQAILELTTLISGGTTQ